MGPLHLHIQVLQLPGMSYVLPAGLLTCCRSTGPVPPSLPWPAVARPPARPTCTVVSTPCSTPNPPTTSGRRTSTCAWTLPWNLVSVEGFSWTCERTPPIEELNLFFFSIFRQAPQILQVWGCRHRRHRLAPRLRLHQHYENRAGALNEIQGH